MIVDRWAPLLPAALRVARRWGRRDSTILDLASKLPDHPDTPNTPRSLPLREQVELAKRLAMARVDGVPWREIAAAEDMAERTLRYHLKRWRRDLERERPTGDPLLGVLQLRLAERRAARRTTAASS